MITTRQTGSTLGSEIRALVAATIERLSCYPNTAEEWNSIARSLRLAADKARKVERLAHTMENSHVGRG